MRPLLQNGHLDSIHHADAQGPQTLCILGLDKTREAQVLHVLSKLRIIGYKITPQISPKPEACAPTSTTILRLHAHINRNALPFEQDIEELMPPNVAKLFLPLQQHKNIRGVFLRAKIPGQPFKSYVSVNDMTAPKLAYLAPRFEDLLLEELYQTISGAVDLTVTRAPRSILEEQITAQARKEFKASGASNSAVFNDQMALDGQGYRFANLTGRFSFRDQAASVWITTPLVRALPTALEGLIGVPIATYRYARLRLCELVKRTC